MANKEFIDKYLEDSKIMYDFLIRRQKIICDSTGQYRTDYDLLVFDNYTKTIRLLDCIEESSFELEKQDLLLSEEEMSSKYEEMKKGRISGEVNRKILADIAELKRLKSLYPNE